MNPPTREHWTCPGCQLVQDEASAGTRCPVCERVLVPRQVLEDHAGDEALGTLVSGKYAVVGVLGTGGFGTVYRAIQEPVGRPVAVKIVHKQHAKDPSLRARFFREARVVAQLSDPVVVTLYDYGDDPEVGLYTVFEFVDGMTLSKRIADGPQSPVWVSYILLQLLKGLAEAHARGMVHRDIKPANIMIVKRPDGDEVVRLLDFGIAKVLTQEHREATVETQQGVVVGTPEFMSPEQARANRELDARSDIYSLGVVAYTLLAGKNPFKRGSVIDTIMAQCAVEPPPFEPELEVPPLLEEAILKALAKEPDDRHQDASAMSAALRAVFPPNTVPAGLTPNPSYTSMLASLEQQTPRSDPRVSAQISGISDAPSGASEAALQMGAGHTMGEQHTAGPVQPSSNRRGLWVAVLLLLLFGGAGVAVYELGGRASDAEPIRVESQPAPENEAPDAPAPGAERVEVATPEPEVEAEGQVEAEAEAESRVDAAAETAPKAEAKPEKAEKPRPTRRSTRRSTRPRPKPVERAPEPKVEKAPAAPPKKEPDSIEVLEF